MELIDVRLMVTRGRRTVGHFWNGKTFTKDGYPVALCNSKTKLYPRRVDYIMTPNEMKEVPFCQKCLSMIGGTTQKQDK